MILLDMEKPKSCKDCRINVYGRCGALRTSVLQEMVNEERNDNCPIKAEIPKNATNGDVIKAMFPNITARFKNTDEYTNKPRTVELSVGTHILTTISTDVWNAPWKGDKE